MVPGFGIFPQKYVIIIAQNIVLRSIFIYETCKFVNVFSCFENTFILKDNEFDCVRFLLVMHIYKLKLALRTSETSYKHKAKIKYPLINKLFN